MLCMILQYCHFYSSEMHGGGGILVLSPKKERRDEVKVRLISSEIPPPRVPQIKKKF